MIVELGAPEPQLVAHGGHRRVGVAAVGISEPRALVLVDADKPERPAQLLEVVRARGGDDRYNWQLSAERSVNTYREIVDRVRAVEPRDYGSPGHRATITVSEPFVAPPLLSPRGTPLERARHRRAIAISLTSRASIVAFPIAWWAMNKWLQDFAYKIDLSWWLFAVSGALALAIALVTVSYQAIKAALANPVKSLRSE